MNKRRKIIFIGCGFVLALIILVIIFYIVVPVFSYESESLPSYCNGSVSYLPGYFNYTISGIGTGTVLVNDSESAVVVFSNYSLQSTTNVFLVRRSDGKILRGFKFARNVVDAGISHGTLYLYNDKIGYFLNASTGEFISYLFTIDNYRGLYKSGSTQRVQTDLEISGFTSGGKFVSRRYVKMKSIVFGCLLG